MFFYDKIAESEELHTSEGADFRCCTGVLFSECLFVNSTFS